MKLHDYVLSADGYKVRLFLAMLGRQWTPVRVDVHPGRENLGPAFRALSPLGTLPVLEDGDVVVRDAQAILTYLALRYDAARTWFPADAAPAAQVVVWLQFAGHELDPLARLRDHRFRSEPCDERTLGSAARRALAVLDDHLAACEIEGRDWLVGDAPTIADIAVFPPVALAEDAGVALSDYPAAWRWISRLKRLPGFVVMPGVYPDFADALDAAATA